MDIPLIIAHAEDPDGIISRSLLMRKFYLKDNSKNHQDHVFVRYDRIVEAFQEASTKASDYGSIFIADIDLNKKLYDAARDSNLLRNISQGRKVFWCDHHQGTIEHKEEISEAGINIFHDPNQCAAMIIAKKLQLNGCYDLKLAKIAQAHDYKNHSSNNKNIKIGNELEKIIALANENLDNSLLLGLADDLRYERCFDGSFNLTQKWQEHANNFDSRAFLAYKELDSSVEIIKIKDYNILFGICPALLSQKPGSSFLREKYGQKADIFVCLFKYPVRNHIVVAEKEVSFPVVPFVQGLGGGGRGNGGGFSLDYYVTADNYQQVKEMLLLQMEKYSK